MTTETLSAGTPSPISRSRIASLTVRVAVDNGDREAFLEEQQAVGDRVRGLREPASEELRHGFVQVQDHRDTDEAEGESGEHEVVRQRGDLGEGESLAPVGSDGRPAGADQEVPVFGQVPPEAGALVALDVEAADPDAVQLAIGRLARTSQPDDQDRPAGGDDGLGLAADPRVLVVVAVDDHEDRPGPSRASGGRGGHRTSGPAALRSAPTIRHPGAGPGEPGSTGRATSRRCRR